MGEGLREVAEGLARRADLLGIETEVVEEDVSGSKRAKDRGLEELLLRAEQRVSGGIVVAWQDRLSRGSLKDTADVWERLGKAGARLIAVGDGVDPAAPGAEPAVGLGPQVRLRLGGHALPRLGDRLL